MPFGLRSIYGADTFSLTRDIDFAMPEGLTTMRQSRRRSRKARRVAKRTSHRHVRRRKTTAHKAHRGRRAGKKRPYPHHLKKYMFKKKR